MWTYGELTLRRACSISAYQDSRNDCKWGKHKKASESERDTEWIRGISQRIETYYDARSERIGDK